MTRLVALLCTLLIGASVAHAQPVESAVTDDIVHHANLVYANYGSRKMRLDLFVPKRSTGAAPTIVVVHGGGWLQGNKTQFHALAQALATRGYVTAAIEYRLAFEAEFPAAIQDCNAAVRWLRNKGQPFGADPNRIGAVGGSAGGHLVGLMAAAPHIRQFQGGGGHADQSSVLQAAAIMAGPLELVSGPVAKRSREQPQQSNANRWFGKTIDEAPQLYHQASPFTHLSPSSPPFLFLVGQHDEPLRNLASRQRLREVGVTADVRVYKDGKHGCWNRHPWFGPMVDDLDEFFTAVLKRKSLGETQPIRQTDWGVIRRAAAGLELHVDRPPADGVITIPRMNNRIGAVYVKGDQAKKALNFQPGTESWSIVLPKTPLPTSPVIFVETLELPQLPTIPHVVSAASNGDVVLAAQHAVTHGKMLRYEPQPHKNTVGYWVNQTDWCEWHFYVEQPGTFDVHILQGCGKGQGGSEVALSIGDQSVRFTVQDTGHFQNFKDRQLGVVQLNEAGLHTLQLRPLSKAAKAIMDVRQLRLMRITSQ